MVSNKKGKLIIFSAPSGSGKTTIVKKILAENKNLQFSISATSRAMRENEEDKKDYYFLSLEEFKRKIEDNEFLEWEEVYENQYYGTLKSEITRIWDLGKHVIFDVDVLGAINIKTQFPDESLAIFIMPPSIETLAERLIGRGTETEESLQKRLSRAKEELEHSSQFDTIVINDQLHEAIERTELVVDEFLKS